MNIKRIKRIKGLMKEGREKKEVMLRIVDVKYKKGNEEK